jgi:CheY-like chemotaxis protein
MLQQRIDGLFTADEPPQKPNPADFLSGSESVDPQPTKRKVLVVDDERRIADTLCEILRLYNFEVVAAYDGWEALELVSRFQPDFLLSDVLMPRMNGVELAIAAHNACPAAKILLFSGQAGISEILQEGEKRGFNFKVIAKPLHPLKLLQQLKEL